MLVVLYIAAVVSVYVFIQLALIGLRNHKAHKFFELNAKNLPVLPAPKLFSGHLLDPVMHPKNWSKIKDLHDQLGPSFGVYYVDQPWVLTKDLDLIKLVEVDQAHKHLNRPNFGMPLEQLNHSIMQKNGEAWQRIRRAVSPAFRVRSEEVSGDIMLGVDKLEASLERKLQKQADGASERSLIINAGDTTQRFALSVFFSIMYKCDDLVDYDVERDQWTNSIDRAARHFANPILQTSIMFPFLRSICSKVIPLHPLGMALSKILKFINQATDVNQNAREQHEKMQRKLTAETGEQGTSFSSIQQQGSFKRRLVDTIIDAFIDKKMTYDEFTGTLMFLLLAGFVTTADTISCLMWHLAREPEIQEKLRRTILEEGIDADYVSWCISETVRIHPAVNLGAGRILSEDITVNGILYPKGAYIMPSVYSIHHDEKIWPNPEKFDPERWQDSNKFHPAAFMGFALGPRNCVGGKLAVHEIKLVIRMLLSKYRIEKCAQTCDKYNFSSPTLIFTVLDQPVYLKFVELPERCSKKSD